MTEPKQGNPKHIKCIICKYEFERKEKFKVWYCNFTGIFRFRTSHPVCFKCYELSDIRDRLNKVCDQDSIDAMVSIVE